MGPGLTAARRFRKSPDLNGGAVAPTLRGLLIDSETTKSSRTAGFQCSSAVDARYREAMARMRAEVKLEVVPGATHLFEEPGTLEVVARLARDWFANHLAGGRAAA